MLNKEVVQVNVHVEGIQSPVAEEMPVEAKRSESESSGEGPHLA